MEQHEIALPFHLMFLTLLLYDQDGVVYDSSDKKTIEKFTIFTLPNIFKVAASVETIVGGTDLVYSAFYNCRNGITNITFEKGSKLNSLGCHVFDSTSIVSCDMTNCESLSDIQDGTFRNCISLVNIILPPNLVKIGSAAITYTNITHIDIPDSVVTLGEWVNGAAFDHNLLLKSMYISPNSNIETIGAHAFMSTAIESFFFPRKLKSFPSCPFIYAGVKKYDVDELNDVFSVDSQKTTILSKDKTVMYSVVNGVSGKYTIISTVKVIKDQAFRNTKFTEIDASQASITSIGSYSFAETKITSLSFNDGLETINSVAFSGSCIANITLPITLKELNNQALYGAIYLKNITLPSKITKIGDQAFYNCRSLMYIEIPASVTAFGSSVFGSCNPNIQIVFLNESRFVIKNNALYFENRTLSDYFGTDENTELVIPSFCKEIPAKIFQSKKLKTVSFEENMQSLTIGESAFSQSTIVSIAFPSCLSSIGKSCFYKCAKLQSISFEGTSVKEIPNNCFYECTKLKTVYFDNSKITTINEYAFFSTGIENVDLRKSPLTTIGKYAFSKSKIISIDLPQTLKTIGLRAFSESSLKTISFDAKTIIQTIDMFAFYKCTSLSNASLCDSLSQLSESTFKQCTKLEHFELPVYLETLKMYSFSNCASLADIKIKENSRLQRIEPFAFEGCSKLQDIIVLDKDNFFFDSGALMNGNKTKLIYYLASRKRSVFVLAGSVIEIQQYAFQSCQSLREVIIPNGALETIGFKAFENCASLARIILPESMKNISKDAFKGCNKLLCGCTKVPEHLKTQALTSGMPSIILSDTCLNTECAVSFGRCTRACNNRKQSLTNVIFLTFMACSS